MDLEDEVPEEQIGTQSHFRHMKKLAPWVLALQVAGYAAGVGSYFAMAGSTRAGVATRSAYDAAVVCDVGGARPCGPDDALRETITVTGSTTVTDDKNNPVQLVLTFTDPSGLVAGGGTATFTDEDMPPLDAATDAAGAGEGERFAAEVWDGELMWVADTADPDGVRYYPDDSVEYTTRFTLAGAGIVAGIDFVFCCFTWWLLVRRGLVSDRGSFRPLYALGCLIVLCVGWELIARTEGVGVTVIGVGLLLSVLLGVPPPPRRWSPATWPQRIRTAAAVRSARRKRQDSDRIFR